MTGKHEVWTARKWLEDISGVDDQSAKATLGKGLQALEFLRELQGELAGEELSHRRVRPRRLALSRRINDFLRGD